MSSKYARPKWWQVYLTFPLLIALFAVDTRLKLSTRGHQAIQIGSVLIIFGLVRLWLKANARTLSSIDKAQLGGRVTIIKIQPHELPLINYEYKQHSVLHLPDLEIKGTLSDTFEMDYVDAESFKVEEYRKN